ncbi:Alanyl-tRNA synthetase [hydrothermal vent metagenome]|uniref:Alanine--tRNA ligase n=1 Tax=hydrothermal vent metagenome TaxID=652676 RepID=A0A3B1AMG6_9ZZZZ
MKTSADIRKAFLDFFHSRQHEIVASSSLVPGNDPTLLFTNAGMVQFKDVFLGQDKRAYTRATSSQRCVRAGGKHNDLENVGYTARHHTFFEMLGNFSFGDYFKRDAIQYAWAFLTQEMGLPADKLWVTVFDEDDEAADIWLKEIKVDPARFSRIGAKDNFWSMGDTGPCGPCSEIFYDHGDDIPGGPPGTPEEDGDRYIEIWNLVFMQYDRDSDGKLTPLPKPSVDTGMGLERLAAIMQNGHSNYDIDLFQALIKAIAKLAKCKDLNNNSLKVIADHIRSCSFMIVDGVIPSNEGRGYVLRRIIRRAIRHGHKLGMRDAFFYKLVAALVKQMGEAYPELTKMQSQVEKVLKQEELRFAETLDQGMVILEQTIAELAGKEIPGDMVFKLYDTYGFPFDLTADIARERDLTVDKKGFDKAMGAQRERARSAKSFSVDYSQSINIDGATEFTGYSLLKDNGKIIALLKDGEMVEQLSEGEQGMLIMDQTPFYAESGGQVGDHGELVDTDSGNSIFNVSDTQKQGDVFAHIGNVVQGSLKVGDSLEAFVDESERQQIAEHHSATHLMHAALRDVLGEHVQQKGSLVDAEKLRFDFSHFEPITAEQLAQIEALVNTHIRCNHDVETKVMSQDDAIASGAMALFGEKYGDSVRVLNMGDFSIELCGGTHVQRTGDLGIFKITSETGVAAGVRRIEAVAGAKGLEWVEQGEETLTQIADLVKSNRDDAAQKVEQLLSQNRKLEKELDKLKAKMASSQGSDLASQAEDIAGIKVLAVKLDGADAKVLRETLDQLKNKLGSAAVVLAAVDGEKVSIVAGVSKDKTDVIKAGDLVNVVAEQVGGRGGGRPDMAQAGGNKPASLDGALKLVPGWVKQQIGV